MRGMIKPSKLVAYYVANGTKAACITDYNSISAAIELYGACNRAGIKPIVGIELNVTADKTAKKTDVEHIVLLAKNRIGFTNLVKLTTIASQYFYYAPRVDWSDLAKYNDGIIAITGDMYGVASYAFFRNKFEGLLSLHARLSEIYSDLYYEIEPVSTDSNRVLNEALVDFCLERGAKLVATGDPHYLTVEDGILHQSFMGIRNVHNAGWVYPFKCSRHVKSYQEMVDDFAELHGYDVSCCDGYSHALAAPNEIIDMVQDYKLRDSIVIPKYEMFE